MHDTPAELAQPDGVRDWKKGECALIPGKTAPQIAVVERDYPNLYKRFTALGPLMDRLGNGGKGRSEEHTSELQSPCNLVCRLLLEKKKKNSYCTYKLYKSIHAYLH